MRHLAIVRPEPADLEWHLCLSAKSRTIIVDGCQGQLVVGVVVDLADRTSLVFQANHTSLRGSPAASRPSSLSWPSMLRRSWAMMQTAAAAVERVGLAATMAEGLVLHPSPALVQRALVGEAHHMKRVGDLDGVGEHRVEDRLVGRMPTDPASPRRSRPAIPRGLVRPARGACPSGVAPG